MTASLIISAYLIGLAGSIHCIGMCGPMVGLMESSIADAHSPLWRFGNASPRSHVSSCR